MIDSIRVRHFQSLHDVEVELSRFTVLVGPSSSGKSAFVRAIRTWLMNKRGNDFIEHGEKQAEITGRLTSGVDVTLRRSKTAAGKNEYETSTGELFTKLGGETPEEITRIIGIDPALSIAGQFDSPYLLTAPGSEVARTLGSLTNVDMLHRAGREANRLKLQSSASAKHEDEVITRTEARLEEFEGLDEQAAAIERAEQSLADAQQAVADYDEAVKALQLVKQQKQAVEDLRASLGIDTTEAEAALAAAEEAEDTYREASALVGAYAKARYAAKDARDLHSWAEEQQDDAEEAFEKALAEAGVCPLCGHEVDTSHDHR